jgi:hypothetical protein
VCLKPPRLGTNSPILWEDIRRDYPKVVNNSQLPRVVLYLEQRRFPPSVFWPKGIATAMKELSQSTKKNRILTSEIKETHPMVMRFGKLE